MRAREERGATIEKRVSEELPKSGYGVAWDIFSVKGDPFQEGLLLVEEEPMGTKAALQGALPPTSLGGLRWDGGRESLQEPDALTFHVYLEREQVLSAWRVPTH